MKTKNRLSEALGLKNKKWYKRRDYVRMVTILTGIFVLIFAIITFYGLQTGSFTLMVNKPNRRGLQLSETIGFENPTSRLFSTPLIDITNITQTDLEIDKAINTEGRYEDPNYIAYTFYIRNAGAEMFNLEYRMFLYDPYKHLDEAIRIMIIENDLEEIEIREVYKKPGDRNYPNDLDDELLESLLSPTDFLDKTLVGKKVIEKFQPQQIRKFTLLIWVEGWDSDDRMLGGAIKFRMDFSISDTEVE